MSTPHPYAQLEKVVGVILLICFLPIIPVLLFALFPQSAGVVTLFFSGVPETTRRAFEIFQQHGPLRQTILGSILLCLLAVLEAHRGRAQRARNPASRRRRPFTLTAAIGVCALASTFVVGGAHEFGWILRTRHDAVMKIWDDPSGLSHSFQVFGEALFTDAPETDMDTLHRLLDNYSGMIPNHRVLEDSEGRKCLALMWFDRPHPQLLGTPDKPSGMAAGAIYAPGNLMVVDRTHLDQLFGLVGPMRRALRGGAPVKDVLTMLPQELVDHADLMKVNSL